MEQEQLQKKLKAKYETLRSEKGYDHSFEELDEIFFIQDYVLNSGYISPQLNRMIASRIEDTFNSWVNKLHSWVIPNPKSLVQRSESNAFTDEEKQKMKDIISAFKHHSYTNRIAGVAKDEEKDKAFINKSVELWNKHKDDLQQFLAKSKDHWEDRPL